MIGAGVRTVLERRTVTPELGAQGWDAIVIGAGLAGMTTALTLANRKKRVLLLEQHLVPGGYATCFKRKGFTFDVSLHQTPGLGPGQFIHTILTELGVMERIGVIPLRETGVFVTPYGEIAMDRDFLKTLAGLFPSEAAGLDALDRLLDGVMAQFPRAMRWSWLPEPLHAVFVRFLAPAVDRLRGKTLADCLAGLTPHKDLQRLIAVQWGYFGLPLSGISAIAYLLAWGGFLKEGIYYIKGSSQALSNALVDRLEECGGRLLLRQRVERILVEGGRVAGVVSRDVQKGSGETAAHTFRAPRIVSSADPFATFERMLPAGLAPPATMELARSLDPSISAYCVYIGLDCKLSNLTGNHHHSVAYLDDGELDCDAVYEARREGRAAGFDGYTDYSEMDPDLSPPGKSSVVAIRVEFMRDWESLGEAQYRARKEACTQQILDAMERRIPGLRSHIEVLDAGTPRTMKSYTSNHQGAFMGFAYTTRRVGIGKGGLPLAGPVPGLYLSSAWAGATSGGYYGSIATGYTVGKVMLRSW